MRRLGVGVLCAVVALPQVAGAVLLVRTYARYRGVVDRRLEVIRWAGPSRLYSRPFTIHRGSALSADALVRRLNALSYDQKPSGQPGPGEFVVGDGVVTLHPRQPSVEPILVFFDGDHVADIRGLTSQARMPQATLERELITYLGDSLRAKRRFVRYDELPASVVSCVLAAEDRRFFQHPGIDVARTLAAAVRNAKAESYVQGGSTITQQLVKNFFLTPQKTLRRKLQEALLAFALERRATKKEILELYLNEVYLGQIGSFGVHGMGEAARLYFSKDVTNLNLAESALLAGLIQSPNRYNPHRHPAEAQQRRNFVLQAAEQARFVPSEAARAAEAEPVHVARETLESYEAPYFVDLVKEQLEAQLGAERAQKPGLSIYTTLDPYLQEVAQEVLVAGLKDVEKPKGKKRKATKGPPIEGSIVVMEPETGAIVALVGGRSYESTQFDRATQAHRQPGSTFKPFVYLSAFEGTFENPEKPPLTPATLVDDSPSSFVYEQGEYMPGNSDDRYLGIVTLRRALAMSLNAATMKVAEFVGYDHIAGLFSHVVNHPVQPYPALALGAFESTPLEMASAFGVLATGGVRHDPITWTEIKDANDVPVRVARSPAVRVVRPQSAFLVTNMLRSVLDEGTAAAARRLGLRVDAAGKTGTTNETRDAWFIGYTPDLLCAVWVGYDDNRSLHLSGAEAALPIWVDFMKKALAGVKSRSFSAPRGIVYADIDKESGLLATASCPRHLREAFIDGAVPTEICPYHLSSGGTPLSLSSSTFTSAP
jgi:penicillin-binding protein 1B